MKQSKSKFSDLANEKHCWKVLSALLGPFQDYEYENGQTFMNFNESC